MRALNEAFAILDAEPSDAEARQRGEAVIANLGHSAVFKATAARLNDILGEYTNEEAK